MISIFIVINLFRSNLIFASDVQMGGFIFDQTKTRLGREFYDLFVIAWAVPEDSVSFNITISEFTDPRYGSQISIYVDEDLIYTTVLRPRYEDMEQKVNEAVNTVLQYFLMLSERNRALQEELKIFY